MSDHRIPIKRALVSVYDKTGLEDLVRGLHDAGVALVSTGGSAALIEGLGVPVTKVEDLTGFPECLDGRVKTLHPKVHAGILADRRLESHVAAAGRAGRRAVRPGGLQPLPLHPDRRLGRDARRVRRADRHRRAVDGPGGGQEPPVGRDRHLAGAGTPTCWPPSPTGGFTLAQRQRLAAEAFVHTATYDVAVASWMGNVLTDTSERAGLPRVGRRHLGQGRGAALRREPAPERRALPQRRRRWPRAGRAAARQGDVLQQLRRHRRGPARGVRLRPSRRSRSSSTRTRAASRSAPTSPRRTARRTRATRSRRSAA